MSEPKQSVVSLNDVSRLLTALTSGDLRDQLGLASAARADCDIRCGCNTRDCECNGSKTSALIDEVSFPEFEKMRAQRVDELKAQLGRLEQR